MFHEFQGYPSLSLNKGHLLACLHVTVSDSRKTRIFLQKARDCVAPSGNLQNFSTVKGVIVNSYRHDLLKSSSFRSRHPMSWKEKIYKLGRGKPFSEQIVLSLRNTRVYTCVVRMLYVHKCIRASVSQ